MGTLTFLIAYATGEGQTETIGERIGAVLRDRGHTVVLENVDTAEGSAVVSAFDAVLVGASIHGGKHQGSITQFVERNGDALSERPTAFFQISLSSATAEGDDQAAQYVDQFIEATGWYPDRIARIGGALRYSKYGFLKRLLTSSPP